MLAEFLGVELAFAGALGGLVFLFAPLLHLVGMVVIVGEGVVNSREIEIVVRGHILGVLAFVDNTGSDMEHADTASVDPRFTTERIFCRDDLGHTRCSVWIDKEVRPLGLCRSERCECALGSKAEILQLQEPAQRSEQDRWSGHGVELGRPFGPNSSGGLGIE